MRNVTITVSSPANSGSTFIKCQIAKHLRSLGLTDVEILDSDPSDAILDRTENPSKFVDSLKRTGVKIAINGKQLSRSECK